MKTLNYSKLTQRFLGFAGLVVAGTVVGLPASAQVESPSMPMGAPSLATPKEAPEGVTPPASAPASSIPSVDDAIESTVNSVQEVVTPGSTETTDEATEATETTETEAPEATEATTPEAPEATEATKPEAPEATETEASEATEVPEAAETTETTETIQSKPTTSEVAPTGEAAPTTTVPSTTVPTTTVPSTGAPSSEAPATEATPSLAAASGTIVDVASASNTFQTLVSALTEAQLAEVLQGEGPFTVFAPTDEAFAALPPGVLDELMKPENREILVKILKYHVVSGEVASSDLTAGEVETAEGSPINVAVDANGGVTVNGANVVQADIPATNGVIHAIDRVIIPPDLK